MNKIILLMFLLLIAGCTITRNENIIEKYEPSEKYNLLVKKYNNLTAEYNQIIVLAVKYNNLTHKYNKIVKENKELNTRDYISLNILNKCREKGTSISIPKKPLNIKTICNNKCDYYLHCSYDLSMLPFFDCKDRLTVFSNVKQNEIEECDIIGFHSPEVKDGYYRFIIHQVINITDKGYVTKGTGNDRADDYIVKQEDVLFKIIGIEYGPKWDGQSQSYWR